MLSEREQPNSLLIDLSAKLKASSSDGRWETGNSPKVFKPSTVAVCKGIGTGTIQMGSQERRDILSVFT